MAKRSSQTLLDGAETGPVESEVESPSQDLLERLEAMPARGELLLNRAHARLVQECEALSELATELRDARVRMVGEFAEAVEEARTAHDAWKQARGA